jgi:Universal stress protein family
MKILVAYDETLDAESALKYGIRKVCESGGDLIVLNVFPKHLFIDYDAGPKAEEIARRESFTRVEGALQLVRTYGRNVRARLIMVDGHAGDEVLSYAKSEDVDLIVSPPSFDSIAGKAFCLMDIVSAADEDDPGEFAEGRRGLDGLVEARSWRSS